MSLEILVEYSNRYGKNPAYVLAGGGNTSYKTGDTLYVKGSGTSLASITADGFVRMNRAALAAIWEKTYSDDQAKREAEVLADMMSAKLPAKRQSVPPLKPCSMTCSRRSSYSTCIRPPSTASPAPYRVRMP